MNLSHFQTLIFDCDGVILNSNTIKTEAFYQVALPYGRQCADSLVAYHVAHGGVSRYQKFQWFVDNVLDDKQVVVSKLVNAYAMAVKSALLQCEVTDGLLELREQTKHTNWLIVSGSDQNELREVFQLRQLADLFDGGIFGSPDDKKVILAREMANGNIKRPALFLGDSRYDFESAYGAGLDFVFLSQWTEFYGWQDFFVDKKITVVNAMADLLP